MPCAVRWRPRLCPPIRYRTGGLGSFPFSFSLWVWYEFVSDVSYACVRLRGCRRTRKPRIEIR
jgi:hypothetical protein